MSRTSNAPFHVAAHPRHTLATPSSSAPHPALRPRHGPNTARISSKQGRGTGVRVAPGHSGVTRAREKFLALHARAAPPRMHYLDAGNPGAVALTSVTPVLPASHWLPCGTTLQTLGAGPNMRACNAVSFETLPPPPGSAEPSAAQHP